MRAILGLVLLLLLPASSWANLRSPSIFKYIYGSGSGVSWSQARINCRRKHTDLLTIRNRGDTGHYFSRGWIGLYQNSLKDPWRWSAGDEVANFTYWDEGQPGSQGCAFRPEDGGYWWSDNCRAKRNFTCYQENLFLVKENKTWEEAVEHCKLRRYELATLLTEDDLAFAREKAEGATTDEVWTGLRHLAGRWLWVSGAQRPLNQFPDCPAEGSCGALLIRGSQPIHTSNCELRKNFICSIKHRFVEIQIV